MSSRLLVLQFILGLSVGAVIACSPTRFNPGASNTGSCAEDTGCIADVNGLRTYQQNFEVGAGKVDILFVNDNSASMAVLQEALKVRFAGFIQNLDAKKIDYQIAMVTSDLARTQKEKLITFKNNKQYISTADANRVELFKEELVRSETLKCENLIISMFNTHGPSFRSRSDYASEYTKVCPAPDTRGLYTSHLVVSENTAQFIRSDANLNIILLSNDNERQSRKDLFESMDTAAAFTTMMSQKYPTKYWDFNSIIVKDNSCKAEQVLKNAQSQTVIDENGQSAISGNIGEEFATLSNSAAQGIDGNQRARGKVLNICDKDYTQHFNDIATQISDEARMLNLKCAPSEAPTVTIVGQTVNSPVKPVYQWKADKIIFQKGYEGTQVQVGYKCFNGAK